MLWLNEPPAWRDEGGVVSVTTAEKTDYWRHTHYGFVRDDGHLRYERVAGDFTAEVAFAGEYRELYDQAGLMVRIDERNWLKAGIEFVGSRQMLSVVVTREYSDWSTAPVPVEAEWLRLRLSRHASAIRVEWAGDEPGAEFALLRLAYLAEGDQVSVGPMCCSPQRAGFQARFRDFAVRPLIPTALHG